MRYFLLIATLWLSCSLCSAQTSDSLIVNQLRGKGVSFSHDNSVTLLMNGQEKFDDMFQAIRQAKHSVHLEYFNFRNDSIASLLFDILAQKVKEGTFSPSWTAHPKKRRPWHSTVMPLLPIAPVTVHK